MLHAQYMTVHNHEVGGSIPPLATKEKRTKKSVFLYIIIANQKSGVIVKKRPEKAFKKL